MVKNVDRKGISRLVLPASLIAGFLSGCGATEPEFKRGDEVCLPALQVWRKSGVVSKRTTTVAYGAYEVTAADQGRYKLARHARTVTLRIALVDRHGERWSGNCPPKRATRNVDPDGNDFAVVTI